MDERTTSYIENGQKKTGVTRPTYNANTDYSALMQQAANAGDYNAAGYYEQQRNDKIAGSGEAYGVNDRLRYGGKLYKVVQVHTSQDDWTPDATPALFTEVAPPGEILVWKQPAGAHDAYNKGDKVYYPNVGDTIYICTVDGNAYAPDVYGWEVYHE